MNLFYLAKNPFAPLLNLDSASPIIGSILFGHVITTEFIYIYTYLYRCQSKIINDYLWSETERRDIGKKWEEEHRQKIGERRHRKRNTWIQYHVVNKISQ